MQQSGQWRGWRMFQKAHLLIKYARMKSNTSLNNFISLTGVFDFGRHFTLDYNIILMMEDQ
jgi:hypothetical protein